MYDFCSKRYQNQVILLKSIPRLFCKYIGEGHLCIAHPYYNIILSEGFNFGKIEIAINSDGNISKTIIALEIINLTYLNMCKCVCSGHSFAVKKLLKNSKLAVNVASKLINIMDNLVGLNGDNILPYTHCIEYATVLWLATPMCEYNLESYIDLTYKQPNYFCLNLRNTVKQVKTRIELYIYSIKKIYNFF